MGPPTGSESESASPSVGPAPRKDTKADGAGSGLGTLLVVLGALVVLLGVGGTVGLYLTREPKDEA